MPPARVGLMAGVWRKSLSSKPWLKCFLPVKPSRDLQTALKADSNLCSLEGCNANMKEHNCWIPLVVVMRTCPWGLWQTNSSCFIALCLNFPLSLQLDTAHCGTMTGEGSYLCNHGGKGRGPQEKIAPKMSTQRKHLRTAAWQLATRAESSQRHDPSLRAGCSLLAAGRSPRLPVAGLRGHRLGEGLLPGIPGHLRGPSWGHMATWAHPQARPSPHQPEGTPWGSGTARAGSASVKHSDNFHIKYLSGVKNTKKILYT